VSDDSHCAWLILANLQPVQQSCFPRVVLLMISAGTVGRELEKRTSPNISILISFLVHRNPDKIFDRDPPILLAPVQTSQMQGLAPLAYTVQICIASTQCNDSSSQIAPHYISGILILLMRRNSRSTIPNSLLVLHNA